MTTCAHMRLGRYVGGQLYCEDCGEWLRLEIMGKPKDAEDKRVATAMPKCWAEATCRCGEIGIVRVEQFKEVEQLTEGLGAGVFGFNGVDTMCRRCGRRHMMGVALQVTEKV